MLADTKDIYALQIACAQVGTVPSNNSVMLPTGFGFETSRRRLAYFTSSAISEILEQLSAVALPGVEGERVTGIARGAAIA